MRQLLLGSGGFGANPQEERRKRWNQALDDFTKDVKEVLFVPFALFDHEGYTQGVREKQFSNGKKVVGIHEVKDPLRAIEKAECVYVGGGNTFRLVSEMYRYKLIKPLRERVMGGMKYVGVSAGTNFACPTAKTTNDMPIELPPSLETLGLIHFQINPHYFAGATHIKTNNGYVQYGGETRDDRIREFHEMNNDMVLGLWEGSILRVNGEDFQLLGTAGARLFRKGLDPIDIEAGSNVTALLNR